MKHTLKKSLAMLLAFCMAMSLSVGAFATEVATTWYGGDVKLDVGKGEDGYNYMLFGDIPNYYYYETSNHTVKKEVTGGGAVHVLALIDTATYNGEWTPKGIYSYGDSNYDIVYCCDAETGSEAGDYYKRLNLEDGEYFTDAQAKQLRAILTNTYPFVSVEEAKAALKAAGFEQADELDRSELITATQAAVWSIANEGNGDSYRYNKTATTAQKNTWGGYLHDFSAEITNFTDSTTSRKYITPDGVGDRINALIDFMLKDLQPVEAEDDQIVISKLEILETIPVVEKAGYYQVVLQAELNHAASAKDRIDLEVLVDGNEVEDVVFEQNENVYTAVVEAKADETIKVVVSGTQTLEKGVYFYAPKPQDIDGDGIATSREVSQNLIGVAEGETEVYAEDEVKVVVDPVTGNVTLQKINQISSKPVTGVVFELSVLGQSGNMLPVDTLEVDENGQLSIENLLPGTYELKEIKAPYGYSVPEEPIRFEIKEDGILDLLVGANAEIVVGDTNEYTQTVEGEIAVGDELPVIVLQLIPGEETNAEIKETIGDETIQREAYGWTTGEVATVNTSSIGETTPIAPVYDVIDGVKEDKGGMFDYQFNSGLTSKYSNPSTWTNMPATTDVRYVGTGEHSKYYVYVAYIEYEKNEDGSAKVDENGNYVIKQIRRYDDVTSPSLTVGGVETTELFTEIGLESQYDNPGGSRPFLFAMKDRNGQAYYGYCCDLDTPTNDGFYYTIANLEDSDYYGSEESEAHIRSIVMNGYWGTTGIPDENGDYAFGSLELLKQKLIAYIDANPELNTSLTAPVLDRNNKYQPVVDEAGNVVTATKTMKEMVEGLTSGEALLATQAAIWSYANGSYEVLNGKDGSIVLDPDGYKWNHDPMTGSKSAGGYTNGEAMDDFASTAVDFLYTWLINLDTEEESTTVINDKNFIEDLALEIGNKVVDTEGNDVYAVDVSFELGFVPGEKDDLSVELSYGDSVIGKKLAGEGADITKRGDRYVIEGLEIPENEIAEFTVHLKGTQYLEHGAYVYLAHGGRENSQNFVGVAEGEKNVDVSKSVTFSYEADESKTIEKTYTQVEQTLIVENTPPYVEWNPGEASNISFMLIDKETGEVEFLYKEDIGSETSHEIPVEEGKVSVVFIKQSTSGMFWFSEEVDEETQQIAIECLKDNNPSYKGHNAVAFGEGSHKLEFKPGKIATYDFHFGKFVEIEEEETPLDPVEPETKPETEPETEPETPVVPEPSEPEVEEEEPIGIGTKTSDEIEGEDRYEIEIAVPGQDAEIDPRHDEIILMVDGSYSMDNEWPAMKEAINTIGETVLNGSGNTQLTLMAFGMADNEVLVHVKDADELAAALGELPGNLLYGRSSTNCEAGFTGVAEYIENHDNTLKDVHVIFISDGNVNTDETPRAFDANWQTWTKFGALAVAQEAFGGTVSNGENLPEAFITVFGDRFDGATREEIIERGFAGEVTEEEFLTFAEQVWTDVYAYSGLTRGEAYPVSDAERAFVKYDKENGTYIQDLFYYTTYKSAYVTYGDRWTRTPAAADELAAMNEVKAMYVVDYDGYTSWMDTGITSEKSTFVQSNGIAGLCEALADALVELAKTPFNDVVVTDYMSKWVNLDASTLKIVDNATGETIWTAVEGWLIDENRPTAQEVPVAVELVDPSEYEAGGADVIGNTSGDIYKLTWYVKDGAMLRSDTYSLKYEVTVDTEETDFVSNEKYPANGNTDLNYIDENGEEQTNEIKVPDVEAEKKQPDTFTVTFENGDASNISFMLIDKATGEVEFLEKIDIGDETSFEIPAEEGKISAVFIKQSTSGMFWFSEEVDEETQQAVIECLKDNNPSYKGHNAIAFGAGDHDLEFKKNKFVTYTFTGGEATVAEEPVEVAEVVEVVEETSKKSGYGNKKIKKNK